MLAKIIRGDIKSGVTTTLLNDACNYENVCFIGVPYAKRFRSGVTFSAAFDDYVSGIDYAVKHDICKALFIDDLDSAWNSLVSDKLLPAIPVLLKRGCAVHIGMHKQYIPLPDYEKLTEHCDLIFL